MTDLATVWNTHAGTADWRIGWLGTSGYSEPTDDLLTAVLISLFTDAAAGADEVVDDGTDDARGWWAGPIGSKLWLRARAKATPTLLALVKDDIVQALAWLIEDDVVAAIDVTTEYARTGFLAAQVTLRRNDGSRHALAFSRLWETT